MWPAFQKIKFLNYRGNGNQQIVFFDDNEKNFYANTDPLIITIKVNNCGVRKYEDCETILVKKMVFEEDQGVKDHFLAMKNITQQSGFEDYFDGYSGLDKETLETYLNSNDVFVFDWDRTITQCEGFLFSTNDFDEYYNALKYYYTQLNDSNIESHVKALCGGTSRFNMLREQLNSKIVSPDNIYIITNNKLKGLILRMMRTLRKDFLDDHIFSMHEHLRSETKLDIIRKIILPKVLPPPPPTVDNFIQKI